MAAIRVMIGDMPVLLRSLVEGILAENRLFEVVNVAGPRAGPGDAAPDFDVVVLSETAMQRTLPGAHALGETGRLGIVAISCDGKEAAVIRLRSKRNELDDSRGRSLPQAIVDAAGPGSDGLH